MFDIKAGKRKIKGSECSERWVRLVNGEVGFGVMASEGRESSNGLKVT